MNLTDRIPHPPTADAIYEGFVDYAAERGLTLYPAQDEALLELVTGSNVVLSTPTGSGKSLVAAGAQFAALANGRRSFYTAPIKALVSEKFFDLCGTFGPANVGMMTGDATVNGGAPVICCTAEILANLALREPRLGGAPRRWPHTSPETARRRRPGAPPHCRRSAATPTPPGAVNQIGRAHV